MRGFILQCDHNVEIQLSGLLGFALSWEAHGTSCSIPKQGPVCISESSQELRGKGGGDGWKTKGRGGIEGG